jgi:RES domain-containing protein
VPDRDPPPDSRWQRGAAVDAVYLADEPDTAWAEWYRHLAEVGVPPQMQMPRDLWAWAVNVEVADLSDTARLARLGLPVPRPGRRSWHDFQDAGEALYEEGWSGLLAPSAARPEHLVVCLVHSPAAGISGAEPLPPPTRVTQVPRPPTGMTT